MENTKKSTYNGYTEARKKSNAKWNASQAQISIRVHPDIKKEIEDHIRKSGESLAGFLVRAARAQIEREEREESE